MLISNAAMLNVSVDISSNEVLMLAMRNDFASAAVMEPGVGSEIYTGRMTRAGARNQANVIE